jgi:hypothetical protein
MDKSFTFGKVDAMAKRDEKSFDFLTGREADFVKSAMSELAETPWAKPLVDGINATGGLTGDNKAKLFELRFGHSLHRAGILPRYETAGEVSPRWTTVSPRAAVISSLR